MRLLAAGLTDLGRRREKNEDCHLIDEAEQLYIVADGMGGHQGGHIASQLAVATVHDTLKSFQEDPNQTLASDEDIQSHDYVAQIRYAFQLASAKIYERACAETALQGMGTTMVLLWAKGNKIYVANVGDSRGYLIREGKIRQLTRDHSLVGEQVRAGVIRAEEARLHRYKNIITRSVGFQEVVEVDVATPAPHPGDRFLLCSDGLTNMVDDEEIRDLVSHHPIPEGAARLIDLANARGGDDNITVILLEVGSGADQDATVDLEG